MASRICFALTYYKETFVDKCLAAVKNFYPDATVLTFSDTQQRLKLLHHGGAWTARYMKAFLETDCDLLIKIDPDTEVTSRVTTFPDSDVFAAVTKDPREFPLPLLHGSAVGYTRECVPKIMALLDDPKYKASPYFYQRYQPPFVRPWEEHTEEQVALQDFIVSDIAHRLKLSISDWDAVWQCLYHERVAAVPAAFLHPASWAV